MVGEVAVDEGGALVGVVLRAELGVEGGCDGVGEVHEGGAGVEEDGHVGAREERGLVAADAHVGQGNDELGVDARFLDDGQRAKLAGELVCVDTAEEDAAGRGIEVVQPQRVSDAADSPVVLQLLRQVRVGVQSETVDLHFVDCVANTQDALW